MLSKPPVLLKAVPMFFDTLSIILTVPQEGARQGHAGARHATCAHFVAISFYPKEHEGGHAPSDIVATKSLGRAPSSDPREFGGTIRN
jgi:hypothetical protein